MEDKTFLSHQWLQPHLSMDDNKTLTKMDSHCAQPKYCGHWTATVSFSQKSTEKGIGTRVKHAQED